MPSWWDDPTTSRGQPRRLPGSGGVTTPPAALHSQRRVSERWWDDTRVGVFETLAVVRGRPVALAAHWRRLEESQRTVGRPLPPPRLRAQIMQAARALPGGRGGLRVAVVSTAGRAALTMSVLPRPPRASAAWQAGVAVVTAAGHPVRPATVPSQIKGIERLPSILAWGEPPAAAAFEVLWGTARGDLTEGTISNLFLVRAGQVMTPPVWTGVLPGVVRQTVLQLARRLKIPVVEQPLTRHDLFTAAEAFLTNSLGGVVPVRVADGRRIGSRCPGPVTQRLQVAYRRSLIANRGDR